jgi:hypothetical protein
VRISVRRIPAPRVPRVPWWSVALVLGWGAFLVAKAWLDQRGAAPFVLCQFHRVTGRPCPTCGSTRAVLAFARGEPLEALAWNPLVALGLAAIGAWLAFRALTGTRLVLDSDRGGRILLWTTGLLALALNWAWVWDRA